MNAVALTEELNRLTAEIARLERRIAEGEGDITDHILLQATLRTQATTRTKLAASGVGAVIPVSATAGTAVREDDVRPRNVTQLFSTSTHRIGAHKILGVFG